MNPHTCPVCGGSGKIGVLPGSESLHPTAPICHACGGSSIVWEPEPHVWTTIVPARTVIVSEIVFDGYVLITRDAT